MEYIFTNLPQYVRVVSRSELSSAVVSSGHVLLFSEDGTTLTGKLPDGTFVTVGGGIDVTSTTAEAGDVLSGKIFYDSGGNLTIGTLDGASVTLGYVSGGLFQPLSFSGTAASDSGSAFSFDRYIWNLPVNSGDIISEETVYYGDEISSRNVASGGILVLYGNATDMTIHPGGSAQIGMRGIISGSIITGGSVNVASGGSTDALTVFDGGQIVIRGGNANLTSVESGGIMIISAGSNTNTAVKSGGIITGNTNLLSSTTILFGGIVNDETDISLVKWTFCESGWSFFSGTVSAGMAVNTFNVVSGRTVTVLESGKLESCSVKADGTLVVSSGGRAETVTVSSGGTMVIRYGAVTSDITSSAGAVIINEEV